MAVNKPMADRFDNVDAGVKSEADALGKEVDKLSGRAPKVDAASLGESGRSVAPEEAVPSLGRPDDTEAGGDAVVSLGEFSETEGAGEDDASLGRPVGTAEQAEIWQDVCDDFEALMQEYIAGAAAPANPTQTAIEVGHFIDGTDWKRHPGIRMRAIRVATHSDKRDEAVEDCLFGAFLLLRLAFDCRAWRGEQNDMRGRKRVVEPKVKLPRTKDGALDLSVKPRDAGVAERVPLVNVKFRVPRNPDGTLDLTPRRRGEGLTAGKRVVEPKVTVPRDEKGNVSIEVPPIRPPAKIERPIGGQKG